MRKVQLSESAIKSMKSTTMTIGLIVVLAILGVMVVFLVQLKSVVGQSNLRELAELSEEETRSISNYLDIQWNALERIGARLDLSGCETQAELADNLQLERDASTYYDLFMIDDGGNVMASAYGAGQEMVDDSGRSGETGNVVPAVSEESEALNMSALQEQIRSRGTSRSVFHLYDAEGSALGGVETVYFLSPLEEPFDVEGVQYVAVVGRMSVDRIQDNMKISCFSGNAGSSLIDSEGYYLTSSSTNVGEVNSDNLFDDISGAGVSAEDIAEYKQLIQNGKSFSTEVYYNGRLLVSHFAPIDEAGWYFVTSVPAKVVYAESREVMLLAAFVFAAVIVAMIGLSFMVGRTVRDELAAKAQADVRGNFLNNMSHELRTPLNSLVGLNYLMRENLHNPEKLEEYLLKENETARYLKNLVDDILDVSKMQAKGVKLEVKALNLDELVMSVSDMVRISMEEKGLQFICECTFENAWVMGDEVRIKQVLMNILGNALKFTDAGCVKFEAYQTFVPGSRKVEVSFCVTDTGCGMSEEFLPHVFDAFEQEESKVGAYLKGTGLGLSISKMLVDGMDGKIIVNSIEGEGSCFVVELPLEVADVGTLEIEQFEQRMLERAVSADGGVLTISSALTEGGVVRIDDPASVEAVGAITSTLPQTVAARQETAQNLEILLAEDNELNALIMTEILRGAGFEVTLANDGKEAVELFVKSEEGYFDLVLLDWQMPVYDGLTAGKMIRALDRADASRVPIFMCTANAAQENKEEALAAGMDAFLSKPINVKEILKLLENVQLKKNIEEASRQANPPEE